MVTEPGHLYDGTMDSTKPKLIFLHGNGGEGMGNHFWPYARRTFTEMGMNVIAKNFPDALLARQSIWLPFLKNECGADEHSILIGHSSGAIAAMRFAEKNKILGSVLIGAYYTDTGDARERLSGYFDDPWDWPAIRKNQQWIIQFASVDDPFFPIEEPRLVQRELQAEYHEYTDRGHFFAPEFPELIEEVRKKMG